MNNDYVALTEDGIQPRDKAPNSAVIIKPARRRYDGQEVAVVTGADWVGIREDVIERRCHSPLVPVEQATDLAWWLYEKQGEAVFVGGELFSAS